MSEHYELTGAMTWEQARAVAEALGGSCIWGWQNGKKSCYPTGSIAIHSMVSTDAKPGDA